MITPQGVEIYRTKEKKTQSQKVTANERRSTVTKCLTDNIILGVLYIPVVIYFRPFPAGESDRRNLGGGGLDLHCEAG